ncbi:MAG: TonB-dependent receptor, partial [Pyrinomonadaceae bacterium]
MRRSIVLIILFLLPISVIAQTQTTGRITGTVKDPNGALVVAAKITLTNKATGEERTNATDAAGIFAFAFLTPGTYRMLVQAEGFNAYTAELITVTLTETTRVSVSLTVQGVVTDQVTVDAGASRVKTDNATLGQVIDGRTATELPLASRNFTQLLGLGPGTNTYLTDNTVVGRGTQNVSVNGARPSQNNFQINGVDANAGISNLQTLASPALESIAEFKLQTSLYDATYGRTGGGSVQVITKSGSNKFNGTVYDYFRTSALTANNPFLKAAGLPRPVLERNVFGFAFGGPIKQDRAFFFGSYQGTSDRNGASLSNSLSVNVLIDPRLTDNRSSAALHAAFGIHATIPINEPALRLLNARLPNGQFVIPTPQVGGLYFGSAISLFRDQQFNANFDLRVNQHNWLNVKFFFSDAPQSLGLLGGSNVPGFPVEQQNAHRILSIQDIHTLGPNVTNEARIAYNIIGGRNFPGQPVLDSALGIQRSTALEFPGLPLINIASGATGIAFGTGTSQDAQHAARTTSLADTVSISHGDHAWRFGGELRFYKFDLTANILTRGLINFTGIDNFLTGPTNFSVLGNGVTERNLRTTDYNFFVQDNWRLSPKLTLNLGLRYELDLPPYDTQGRISTFDPSLYSPPLNSLDPPRGGIVQAGNPIPLYDLPYVPNVGKRVLKSNDPNNLAPRIGFAYSPFKSDRFVIRGGYGLYYSRLSFQYLVGNTFTAPFYLTTFTAGR